MYLNQKTKYACKPKAKWPNQKKKKKKLQRKDRERSAILEGEREKEREREKWQRERGFGVAGEAVVVDLRPTVVTNLLISA